MKFKGLINQGKLAIADKSTFNSYIANLRDGEIIISVEKPKKIRSLNQNRYGYGIVLKQLSEFTGYDQSEIKVAAKKALGFVTRIEMGSKVYESVRSSATFSTVEWEQYMTLLRKWGDEAGIYIPEPRESLQDVQYGDQ